MVKCQRKDCPCLLEEKYTRGSHYHCVHPTCFARGPDRSKPEFVASSAYYAGRHVAAHDRRRQKEQEYICKVWKHVNARTGALNRSVNEEGLTQFRRSIQEETPEGTGATNKWEERLYVGKAGSNGTALPKAIQRFTTLPSTAVGAATHVSTEALHPTTNVPQIGHTVKFHESEDGEVWFGLCCSQFTKREVLDEWGTACTIRWLDISHRGELQGASGTYYEMTDLVQPQLLESMDEWGNLLVTDEKGFFILLDDPARMEEALANESYHQRQSNIAQATSMLDDASETLTPEDIAVFEGVFRTEVEYLVDAEGTACNPERCGGADTQQPCIWTKRTITRSHLTPLCTRDGPVFLQPMKYICSTHNKEVKAGGEFADKPGSTNQDYHRIGNMMYTTSFMVEAQALYADCLNMNRCRRSIVSRWLTKGLDHIRSLQQQREKHKLRTTYLQRAARVLLALEAWAPSVESLTELQLQMYQAMVEPQLEAYDAAVAAFDGQLLRVDGTFKFASTVMVNDPGVYKGKVKRTYKKVATAALVAVGLEGLCLRTPALVSSESSTAIHDFVVPILRNRRRILGSLSAPVGFVTDSIKQHQNKLFGALKTVYPEFTASMGTYCDEQGMWKQTCVLMLQDIAHREWAFTRKAAPKKHPDYRAYVACVRDLFHQFRVEHNEKVHGVAVIARTAEEWRNSFLSRAEGAQQEEYNSITRSILRGSDATKRDDMTTKRHLEELGTAAMTALHTVVGTYIPRRVLRVVSRRIGMTQADVNRLFPDHGYSNGEQFMEHLRGVHEYFAKVREPAAACGPREMAYTLGTYQGPKRRKAGAARPRTSANRNRRSAPQGELKLDAGMVDEWEPIGTSQLAVEAVRNCAEPITLNGLMGHKNIVGINTEECVVEAVNKHLNQCITGGCVGFDVATMKMNYQRLKWDTAALQRIMYGDHSRRRQAKTQAVAVWDLAVTMLGRKTGAHLFPSCKLDPPRRTGPCDLLKAGFRLRSKSEDWTDDDVKIFFEACDKFHRCTAISGSYKTVYEWIATSELKGRKSSNEVKEFMDIMFGYRTSKRRYDVYAEAQSPAETQETRLSDSDSDREVKGNEVQDTEGSTENLDEDCEEAFFG